MFSLVITKLKIPHTRLQSYSKGYSLLQPSIKGYIAKYQQTLQYYKDLIRKMICPLIVKEVKPNKFWNIPSQNKLYFNSSCLFSTTKNNQMVLSQKQLAEDSQDLSKIILILLFVKALLLLLINFLYFLLVLLYKLLLRNNPKRKNPQNIIKTTNQDQFNQYMSLKSNSVKLIYGSEGRGKTTLMIKWIQKNQQQYLIHFEQIDNEESSTVIKMPSFLLLKKLINKLTYYLEYSWLNFFPRYRHFLIIDNIQDFEGQKGEQLKKCFDQYKQLGYQLVLISNQSIPPKIYKQKLKYQIKQPKTEELKNYLKQKNLKQDQVTQLSQNFSNIGQLSQIIPDINNKTQKAQQIAKIKSEYYQKINKSIGIINFYIFNQVLRQIFEDKKSIEELKIHQTYQSILEQLQKNQIIEESQFSTKIAEVCCRDYYENLKFFFSKIQKSKCSWTEKGNCCSLRYRIFMDLLKQL